MKRGVSACLGIVLWILVVVPAHAEPPTPGGGYGLRDNRDRVETIVQTTDAGVTIYVGIRSSAPGSPGSPGATTLINTPPSPDCTATATHIGHESGWASQGLREHSDAIPYAVNCDDGYFGIAWVPVGVPADPVVVVEVIPEEPTDPRAIAEELLGIVPLPPISLRANPGTGLVAMPSWFWVDGYDGSPLYGSETLGNTTVEVEITPLRYDWHFGDGGFLSTGSLGQPYPAESDVQHTYEQSSLVAGGQFEVQLEITFGGQFRVMTEEDDGEGNIVVTVGDWEPLDPMVRSFVAPYPVQQLQSVLTAGQR